VSRKKETIRYETNVLQIELIPRPVEDGKRTRVNLLVVGSGGENKQPPTDTKPREIDSCWDYLK